MSCILFCNFIILCPAFFFFFIITSAGICVVVVDEHSGSTGNAGGGIRSIAPRCMNPSDRIYYVIDSF